MLAVRNVFVFLVTTLCFLYAADASVRAYRAGAADHNLRTMRGWEKIEGQNPVVITGIIPGLYSVITDGGTVYDVNLSAEPELRRLLASMAE